MGVLVPSGINGALTKYGSELLLQSMFSQQAVIPEMWIALLKTPATSDMTGSTLNEMPALYFDNSTGDTGNPTGYRRAYYSSTIGTSNGVQLNWLRSGTGNMYNASRIEYPQALTDWGKVGAWAIVTNDSGGNVIASGAVDITVYAGDTVVISEGALGFIVLTQV